MNAPGKSAMGKAEQGVRSAVQRARREFLAARAAHVGEIEARAVGKAEDPKAVLRRMERRTRDPGPPSAVRIATELAVARAVDGAPGILDDLRAGCVVLLDVPDADSLDDVRACWRRILLGGQASILWLSKSNLGERMADYDVAAFVQAEPLKARDRPGLDRAAFDVLSSALPLVGISPLAPSHMPHALLAAARHRLVLPPLDASLVAATVSLVTGSRCRATDLSDIRMPVSPGDIAVAVRFDRTPEACVRELQRLQASHAKGREGRELTLDELHGMEPAVGWARGAMADLRAWKAGEIPWSAVDHAILCDGPPGVGKSVFAKAFAAESGLPMVVASLAKWQGTGHLGDLLKAMRKDFDLARAQAPCVVYVDEIDAFGDRTKFTHSHADYSIQVVNGFLEQLDSLEGREGLIYIGSSNDAGRCDPAIVRSGRFNRVVRIGLPDAAARARMLRVRLGTDLPGADLDRLARLADGHSGADVERAVNDARRIARQAARPLAEADLDAALLGDDEERSPEYALRVATHEAGHAVCLSVLSGSTDFTVSIRARGGSAGRLTRRQAGNAGLRSDIEAEIVVLLAGRAAETMFLGEASAGGGGMFGSDLHRATELAAAMVGSFGQAGPHPLLFVSPLSDPFAVLAVPALRVATHEILVRAEARARALLEEHCPALQEVVSRLVRDHHLDGHAVADLIAQAAKVPRRGTRPRGRGRGVPPREEGGAGARHGLDVHDDATARPETAGTA